MEGKCFLSLFIVALLYASSFESAEGCNDFICRLAKKKARECDLDVKVDKSCCKCNEKQPNINNQIDTTVVRPAPSIGFASVREIGVGERPGHCGFGFGAGGRLGNYEFGLRPEGSLENCGIGLGVGGRLENCGNIQLENINYVPSWWESQSGCGWKLPRPNCGWKLPKPIPPRRLPKPYPAWKPTEPNQGYRLLGCDSPNGPLDIDLPSIPEPNQGYRLLGCDSANGLHYTDRPSLYGCKDKSRLVCKCYRSRIGRKSY